MRLHVMQRTVLLSQFCLSVCPSVRCVYCEKTKQRTANILIPHVTAITLVFWHQQWCAKRLLDAICRFPQCSGQTDRQTDRPTDRSRESLMTIGRCAPRATRPNNSSLMTLVVVRVVIYRCLPMTTHSVTYKHQSSVAGTRRRWVYRPK